MDRMERLEADYPNISFIGNHNCPSEFEAALSSSELGTALFYNADLSPSNMYAAVEHEIEHYDDGDVKYNERNEYRAEVNSSMYLVDEIELRDYLQDNPYLGDYDIADHFNITVEQLYKCIQAYGLKRIMFSKHLHQDLNMFFGTS